MNDPRIVLDSVTIGDILSYYGVEYRNSRCKCPIHDGSNPTAFSFTDWGFNCFNCGSKGGKIDLVMAIAGSNRSEAMKTLAEISNNNSCEVHRRDKASTSVRYRYSQAEPVDLELKILEERMTSIDTLVSNFTWRIRWARELAESGRMPLVQFYTETHICDYELEDLDGEYTRAKYNLNQYRKKK